MTGAVLQLAAIGAQDIYLTGNPQITFFKMVYKRHTNFAIEEHKLEFDGDADFDNKVVCNITRNGDLLSEVFLHVELPTLTPKFITVNNENKDDGIPFILGYNCDYYDNGNTRLNKSYLNQHEIISWVNSIGHVIIDYVTVEIGGQQIDKHYGEWLEIWDELTISKCKDPAYNNRMIGKYSEDEWLTKGIYENASGLVLDIPLRFWFCRNRGLSLPLVALQYHEVKIYVKFNKFENCWWNVHLDKSEKYKKNSFENSKCKLSKNTDFNMDLPFPEKRHIKKAYLLANYIYLDTDERKKFAQVSHEYLIDQLQFNDPINVSCNIKDISVTLDFNHPIKEIIWVTQRERVKYFNDWYNFSADDKIIYDDTYNEHDKVSKDLINYASFKSPGEDQSIYMYINKSLAFTSNEIEISSQILSIKKNILNNSHSEGLNGENFDARCSPLNWAVLQLNGQDRFPKQYNKFFDTVQPYLYHSCIPKYGNIFVYSFALEPEKMIPTGSCNFSRVDNATLYLSINEICFCNKLISEYINIRIYATNFNILRIMSGMGGVAYTN
jgi:hypothetical protein